MNQVRTIGIVGGGQLGRMLTQAATDLNLKVIVIDPNENCPAAQVGAEQIVATYYDKSALMTLAQKVDAITIEIEHIDSETLQRLAEQGTPVHPSPATISTIQDKLAQKQFLVAAGVNVADFKEISDEASALAALAEYDSHMLIKTRRGAYDGRGNIVVQSADEVREALEHFAGQSLYTERFIPFQKELAVMVARDTKGNIAAYPVVETVHTHNICHEVVAPALIDEVHRQAAETMALRVATHMQGAGVFGIELFLTHDGQVLVNEIAPRVHNSGHYTIEACETSQFTQHLKVITGQPLGPTSLIVPAAAMVNILGERNGPVRVKGVARAEAIKGVSVHLYGKSPTKIDRKMGHITAVADTRGEALKRARQARERISI